MTLSILKASQSSAFFLYLYAFSYHRINSQKYLFATGIPTAIATSVLGSLNLSLLFRELDDHMTDSAVSENHIFSLIEMIAMNAIARSVYTILERELQRGCSGPRSERNSASTFYSSTSDEI